MIEYGGILMHVCIDDDVMPLAFKVDRSKIRPRRAPIARRLTAKESCDRRHIERAMLDSLRRQMDSGEGQESPSDQSSE